MNFQALIKTFQKKALISGDSCYAITLYARDLDITELDKLSQADAEVDVTIAPQ